MRAPSRLHMSSDPILNAALTILRDAGHQIGDADMLQTQNGHVMGICIDGVPCTFEDVLKRQRKKEKNLSSAARLA
jgi:hypothetical protein